MFQEPTIRPATASLSTIPVCSSVASRFHSLVRDIKQPNDIAQVHSKAPAPSLYSQHTELSSIPAGSGTTPPLLPWTHDHPTHPPPPPANARSRTINSASRRRRVVTKTDARPRPLIPDRSGSNQIRGVYRGARLR